MYCLFYFILPFFFNLIRHDFTLVIPANAPVGGYNLTLESRTDNEIKSVWPKPGLAKPVMVILFNPWSSNDQVG